jgi:ABC-type multidrug transport system fused ATPase/permease subunit
MIMAALFGIGYILMRLLEPWPLKLIFDNVLLGRPLPEPLAAILPEVGQGTLGLLYILVASIVAIGLLGGFFYYSHRVLGAALGQGVAADLRLDLYDHIQRLSFDFHDRRRTGDLIVRLTSDIRMLRDALVSLPLALVEHMFLSIGMLVIMLLIDWQMALIALVLVPALAWLVRKYRRPMKRAIRKQREREGHLATIATETLGAVKVVQGFCREDHEIGRFGSQNKSSLRSGVKAARMEAKFKWSMDFGVALVTAIIVGVATHRILAGKLSPGDLIVFIAYLRIFARPFRRISRTMERMLRATAAGGRVLDMLQKEITVRDRPDGRKAKAISGAISFNHVWFAHRKDNWILEDINLEIKAGEHVAITGHTGSGKSTLISLIPRFYDVAQGAVCVDGRDIRDFTLDSLRKQITLVFQEPVLFAASIAENIAYGKPDASDEEVIDAAKAAGIHEIITRLPNGYETIVGERGGTLSGGQRQCVAIARAMIRNAPIVLLDEPTTGLDEKSANMVLAALERLMEGRTAVVISHDLPKLRNMDSIVVLENGRFIEQVTHDVLLAGKGI